MWRAWLALICLGCGGGATAKVDAAMGDAALADASGDATTLVADAGPDGGCLCDGIHGLCAPSRYCTSAAPCPGALVGLTMSTLTEPFTPPTCHTTAAGRAPFDDSPPRSWTDSAGNPRAACVFVPAATTPRPLLVYLHGSGGSASTIYDGTSLRAKAVSYDLGDGPGFILASDQGPNQVIPNGNPSGPRHDVYYRDLGSPSSNPDVRALDHLIDELVAAGGVDGQRIYLMGWSNGAFFAELYGIARHDTPTPGGHRVAAVAVFDGADPFREPMATGFAGCAYQPYPRSTLPVMLVHRACSIVCCDAAQQAAQAAAPGYDVTDWVSTLKTTIGASDVTELMVNGQGAEVTSCTPVAQCALGAATLQHIRWPDGVADGSGTDYEPRMLDYLRAHPLP